MPSSCCFCPGCKSGYASDTKRGKNSGETLPNLFRSPKSILITRILHEILSKGTRLVIKARKYRRPEDLADPNYYGMGPTKKITSIAQSISARGFAKEQVSYQPPRDVEEQLHKICKKLFGNELNKEWKNQALTDPLLKFKVLTRSIQIFKKNIPNSYLHKLQTVDNLVEYFNTPVDGVLHYDALVRDSDKLPPNLHIMPNTPAFNPETDTFFDGITAFPGRKRIIYTKAGEKFEKIIEWPNI